MAPLNFLITGGQLHGNLGAAAMSIVTVDHIRDRFPDASITFVSKHPESDSRKIGLLGPEGSVKLVGVSQIRATFFDLPILAVSRLMRIKCRSNRVLSEFEACDVVVDIGGITFSDERGISGLLINATWVLLAHLSGKPMVKLSQAFGPFRRSWFRTISRSMLGKVGLLIARGGMSFEGLKDLDVKGELRECADLAFLLSPWDVGTLEEENDDPVIGVVPSSVVYRKLGATKYIVLMTAIIEQLLKEVPDAEVWLLAHCYREGNTLNNNDVPVCRQIYASLSESSRSRTRLIVEDRTPGEMRETIAGTDILLSSRFHAMVSALASGVPAVALGWSHKYREVQQQFDLDLCIDHTTASAEAVCEMTVKALADREELRARILSRLPNVIRSAESNFENMAAFVDALEPAEECRLREVKVLEDVPSRGLCTGCGTCAGMCPEGAVEMQPNELGSELRPYVSSERCTGCGLCLQVCPGIEVDFGKLNEDVFGGQPGDSLTGTVRAVWVAHSTDDDLRYQASSGGVVTEICAFAVAEGLIDGVVAAKTSPDAPFRPIPALAVGRDDLVAMSGSRYCPISTNSILSDLRSEKGRSAFVGLPCHVHGLRKASQHCDRTRETVAYCFGLTCGRVNSFFATEYYLRGKGIEPDDVAELHYRGEGWPGSISVVLKDGSRMTFPRRFPLRQFWQGVQHNAAFGFQHFRPWRCMTCCDRSAELADISFSDPYLPEYLGAEHTGRTLVVARTERGQDLVEAAEKAGKLALESISIESMVESHHGELGRRKAVSAGDRACRLAGKGVPQYNWQNDARTTPTVLYSMSCLVSTFERWLGCRRWTWPLILPWSFLRTALRYPFKVLTSRRSRS